MSSLFIRTYTFTDGTIAYGSQVEAEISNITTILNNLNTAATNWGQVSVLHATLVPLVADCSSGTQDIVDFKNNSVIKASVSSTGILTLTPTSNQIVLGITNTTTLSAAAPSAARVYTFPDVGSSTANIILDKGNYTVTGTWTGCTFVTPALGTPASGILTNCTGTAAGFTAGHVTTNANLTGVITSVGNATSIASQTGTGTKFVVDTSPTLVTPTLGVASATSINFGGTALSVYAEGTWTPADNSGAGLTFTGVTATYTKIGRVVYIQCFLTYPATGSAASANISGLPFTVATNGYGAADIESNSATANLIASFRSAGTNILIITTADVQVTNTNLSGKYIIFTGFYFV